MFISGMGRELVEARRAGKTTEIKLIKTTAMEKRNMAKGKGLLLVKTFSG